MSNSVQRIPWTALAGELPALVEGQDVRPDDQGKSLVAVDGDGQWRLRIVLPALRPLDGRDVGEYLEALREPLGRHWVILMQAGAASLGCWQDRELLHHKVIKKYVVRGRGRAQTTYAKTKGKSRYGSRLRLRNAQALLYEVKEKLHSWAPDGVDEIFYGCPVRSWAEFFNTEPAPPFAKDGPVNKVPFDVKVPSFKELQRIRWLLGAAQVHRRPQ